MKPLLCFLALSLSCLAQYSSPNSDFIEALNAFYNCDFDKAIIYYQQALLKDQAPLIYAEPFSKIADAQSRETFYAKADLSVTDLESILKRALILKEFSDTPVKGDIDHSEYITNEEENTRRRGNAKGPNDLIFLHYYYKLLQKNPQSAVFAEIKLRRLDVESIRTERVEIVLSAIKQAVRKAKEANVDTFYRDFGKIFIESNKSVGEIIDNLESLPAEYYTVECESARFNLLLYMDRLQTYESLFGVLASLPKDWRTWSVKSVSSSAESLTSFAAKTENSLISQGITSLTTALRKITDIVAFRNYYKSGAKDFFPPVKNEIADAYKTFEFKSFVDAMQYPNSFIKQDSTGQLIGIYTNFSKPYNTFRGYFIRLVE